MQRSIWVMAVLVAACDAAPISTETTQANAVAQTDQQVIIAGKDSGGVPVAAQVNAPEEPRSGRPPSPETTLHIQGARLSFELQTQGCDDEMPSVCHGNNMVKIRDADRRIVDSLGLSTVVVNKKDLLFDGIPDSGFINHGYTLISTDFNADGLADLAVRSGNSAGYGGASYTVFLFDASRHVLTYSRPLSELTEDPYLGLFRVEAGRIRVATKSGCCDSEESVYVVDGIAPRLVQQATKRTSADTGAITVTTRTLVDGKWRSETHSE